MAITLLCSLFLKPIHELTVHPIEKIVTTHEKTEVSKKITHCPICDLQSYWFTEDYKVFSFAQKDTAFHKSIYGIIEGFYNKLFDQKRGRAPPTCSLISA